MVFCWKTEKGWDNESLTHSLLPHICFSSHQKRFTTPLPGGKMQGTSVGAEPSWEFRPPRPAELHPVPALAIPRSALFGGTPVARSPVYLVSSVIQSHITPTSTAASLAGQSQTRCQERTEFFSSPHSPAKPVQRHLRRTMWTCLAVTGELYIYCK